MPKLIAVCDYIAKKNFMMERKNFLILSSFIQVEFEREKLEVIAHLILSKQ